MEVLLFLIGLFFLGIPLSVAAMFYAGRLHRSRFAWLLISLVFSPLVGFALLFGLGPAPERYENDEEYVI